MALFGFFGGSDNRANPSAAQKDKAGKSIAAEKAQVAAAMARFQKNGRDSHAFVTLVHELLRHYQSPTLPKDPSASIFSQTDDLIPIVQLVLELKEQFHRDESFDDEQLMEVSINDLATFFGLQASSSAAQTPSAAQPCNRVVYPVGPRSLQKIDGLLAVYFGTFRNKGATPTAFAALVQALLRHHGSPAVPSDAKRPIYAQTSHPESITAMIESLQDEFAGDLHLSNVQLQAISIMDLIKRCLLTRAP